MESRKEGLEDRMKVIIEPRKDTQGRGALYQPLEEDQVAKDVTYSRGEDVKIVGAKSFYDRLTLQEYDVISMSSSKQSMVESRANLNFGGSNIAKTDGLEGDNNMVAILETDCIREEGSIETMQCSSARIKTGLFQKHGLSRGRLVKQSGSNELIKEMYATQP